MYINLHDCTIIDMNCTCTMLYSTLSMTITGSLITAIQCIHSTVFCGLWVVCHPEDVWGAGRGGGEGAINS